MYKNKSILPNKNSIIKSKNKENFNLEIKEETKNNIVNNFNLITIIHQEDKDIPYFEKGVKAFEIINNNKLLVVLHNNIFNLYYINTFQELSSQKINDIDNITYIKNIHQMKNNKIIISFKNYIIDYIQILKITIDNQIQIVCE